MLTIQEKDVYEFFQQYDIVSKYYFCIPTYVLKLVKINTDDAGAKLFKVLTVDFMDSRPGVRNTILNTFKNLESASNYFTAIGGFIIGIVMLVFTIIWCISWVLLLFSSNDYVLIEVLSIKIQYSAVTGLGLIILMFITICIMRTATKAIREFTYSLNKETMDKLLIAKVDKYEELKFQIDREIFKVLDI